MKNSILIFAALAFSVPAFAGSSADLAPDIYNPAPTPTQTAAPTPGTTPFPTYVPPAPTPTPAIQTGTGSINPAANQGQQSQNGGSGANAAAGAALIAAGMALMSQPPTMPAGAALIAMGALAMAQSGEDSGAANQSGQTAAASALGAGTNPAATTNPSLGAGTSAYSNPALKDGTAALTAAGYSLTPSGGLTSPDGTTTPASAFNSAGGMAAAGMDAGTIAQVQKALGDVNGGAGGRPTVSGVAVAEGAGGGGGADHAPGADYSFSNNDASKNPFGMSDAAKRALIAGKTVSFDGDPIGVRGNNIFEMIHVAYQKKRDAKDFLEGEVATGPTMRAPASVAPTPVAMPSRPRAPAPTRINNR